MANWKDKTRARDFAAGIIGDMQKSLKVSDKILATGEIRLEADTAYVYEAYDPAGIALYVGLTNDLHAHLTAHRQSSDWYASAARIMWTQYATRTIAAKACTARIRALRPLHIPPPPATPVLPADANWTALGAALRASREAAGRTQRSIAHDTGLEAATIRQLEAGEHVDIPGAAFSRLDHAHGWADGSAVAVLCGGQPQKLTREQRQQRALAAAENINVMAGV